jgi:Nucleotidyltransferase domain.
MQAKITQVILAHYPHTQAIYLFGSYGTEQAWPNSDVDIALLLPATQAKAIGNLALSDLHLALADLLGKRVDLINLRQVSTVFQMQIITAGRQIFCANAYAAAEFEMLTFSFYQKLNEERREILAEFARTGRAYAV